MTEAVDTLNCGNGRGDRERDDKDNDTVGVGISFGLDGSGNNGNRALPFHPRGGGLRRQVASCTARAKTTPKRGRTAGNDDRRIRR